MQFNADLHIHGRFSTATSHDMNFKALARGAQQKGVHLLATGDCLHPTWLAEIKEMEEVSEGTFQSGEIKFILSTEVEGEKRVHHLIYFPAISSVQQFSKAIEKKASNLSSDGRPNVYMNGEELAQLAVDAGAYVGPAHGFTPWTGMYAHFDSLKGCYGDMASKIKFLELGLSADSNYADMIEELADITFITNSDAHSPQPVRLAREFNVIEAKDMTYKEVILALERKNGRRIILNVGLPPEEGKYNRTACSTCFRQYELGQALALRWRCVCHGIIKKGVRDRAIELGNGRKTVHPEHRPDYKYMIPLSEILMRASGHSSPFTGGVRSQWELLVKNFGNEINVLLEAKPAEIEKIAGKEVSKAIQAFRDGKIKVVPGGGGKYGSVLLPWQVPKAEEAPKLSEKKKGQKTLFEY